MVLHISVEVPLLLYPVKKPTYLACKKPLKLLMVILMAQQSIAVSIKRRSSLSDV